MVSLLLDVIFDNKSREVLLLFNVACLFRTKLAGLYLWVLKAPVYMSDHLFK